MSTPFGSRRCHALTCRSGFFVFRQPPRRRALRPRLLVSVGGRKWKVSAIRHMSHGRVRAPRPARTVRPPSAGLSLSFRDGSRGRSRSARCARPVKGELRGSRPDGRPVSCARDFIRAVSALDASARRGRLMFRRASHPPIPLDIPWMYRLSRLTAGRIRSFRRRARRPPTRALLGRFRRLNPCASAPWQRLFSPHGGAPFLPRHIPWDCQGPRLPRSEPSGRSTAR